MNRTEFICKCKLKAANQKKRRSVPEKVLSVNRGKGCISDIHLPKLVIHLLAPFAPF